MIGPKSHSKCAMENEERLEELKITEGEVEEEEDEGERDDDEDDEG